MKTKEELNQLKNEYETLTAKLEELTEDELKMVTGGLAFNYKQCPCNNFSPYDGDWNNKSFSNCEFSVKAQQFSFDVCYENGVCRNYK